MQERVCNALLKMMENTSGPNSSEYFRLAGYHGWPNQYCEHGQETFPAWHRAYMVDMERALQVADRELGNDGKIGLPYWDWQTMDIKGEFYPNCLVKHFSQMPKDLVAERNQLTANGYDLYSPADIKRRAARTPFNDMVWSAFEQEEHYMAASRRWRRSTSIESPHDSVHVLCGFPMETVMYAAFHPVFFMHHCNVDRIYQKYIEIVQDSMQEFAAMQQRLASQGETNRFLQPCFPFKHPQTGADFMPADAFDLRTLGYVYDKLPGERPHVERARPTYAVFWPIEPLQVVNVAYELHVWVMKADDEASWKPPASEEQYDASPGYAGCNAIFGSKPGCVNCRDRKPFEIRVDVSHVLAQLGLRRSQCAIKVVCISSKRVIPLPSAIPAPKFGGPYFEGPLDETLQKGSEGADVMALQAYLKKYQYYHYSLDGVYGDRTEEAVKGFQKHIGVQENGIADAATKAMVVKPRADVNTYAHGEVAKATFAPKQALKVWVDTCPGYLAREKVLAEVKLACDQWAAAASLTFEIVEDASQASFKIDWDDRSADNAFHFDGKGGSLGEATSDHITLDEAEYWTLQGEMPNKRKKSPFELLPVVLHEMGHVLGLVHSEKPADVMFPYYVPGRVKLSDNDVAVVKALYSA